MAPTDRPVELVLPEPVGNALLAHAREDAPEEVCGVLVGRRGSTDDTAAGDDAPGDIPGDDAPDDENVDVVTGDDVVGFYHSLPRGPPAPSETDRRRATWRGYVYAIVVPGEGVRAWRWTGEAFVELAVRE